MRSAASVRKESDGSGADRQALRYSEAPTALPIQWAVAPQQHDDSSGRSAPGVKRPLVRPSKPFVGFDRDIRDDVRTVMPMNTSERRAAAILFAIASSEGLWLWFNAHRNPRGFLHYEGFVGTSAGTTGWVLAMIVAGILIAYSASRFPSVRSTLFSLSALKLLAVAVAITAGVCEETVFRKLVMDALRQQSTALQVVASAAAFGAAHGVWGAFRGSARAAVGATLATGVLGAALAVVFVASHRVLAPCVTSHVLINLFAEPGLVLAAVRGEMGRRMPADS